METWAKVALSVTGAALLSISATYTANPTAPVMAYVASVASSVGLYLVGLYQIKPRP
jgi:hypothetical protein